MRAPLVFEVKDANGNVLPDVAVTISDRVSGAAAFLYTNESGFGRDSNPTISDANGRVVTWAERGDYVATVTGTGITPFTMAVDSTPSGDSTVDTAWLGVNLYPWRGIYTAAAETTTAASYASLPTPDSILDVVVPKPNSIVGVHGMYMSKGTTTAVASSMLYVNGVPAKANNGTGTLTDFIGNAGNQSNAGIYSYTAMTSAGWGTNSGASDFQVETVTGMAMYASGSTATSGMCWLYVPDAGVYDFELKFQIAGGATLTVKERRFCVWVVG